MSAPSISSVEEMPGYIALETSPFHVLVLVLSVLMIALTVTVLIALWRDSDRPAQEKVTWSVLALVVPILGSVVVGLAILRRPRRDARQR